MEDFGIKFLISTLSSMIMNLFIALTKLVVGQPVVAPNPLGIDTSSIASQIATSLQQAAYIGPYLSMLPQEWLTTIVGFIAGWAIIGGLIMLAISVAWKIVGFLIGAIAGALITLWFMGFFTHP